MPLSGAYAEVQTCQDRLGAHLKGGEAGWIAGGLHYGFTWHPAEQWALTLQPKFGLSYSNHIHHLNHVRQITKFELGIGAMVTYQHFIIGVGYTHMSNGQGFVPSNIGADLGEFSAGYSF